MAKLTEQQELFCREYLIDLDQVAAYIRAGYTDNPDSARSNASRLLAKVSIQARLVELKRARIKRANFDQDAVLRETWALASSSIDHYRIDADGNVMLAPGAPEDAMQAIASIRRQIRTDKDGNRTIIVNIKLWDKPASLRLVGSHLGIFRERFELNNTNLNVNLQDLSDKELADLAGGESLARILERRSR